MRDWTPPSPPELPIEAHKGVAGRVLLVCGSAWMPGAAILSARAAQRAGAGLVAVACQDDLVRYAVPIAAPEAVLIDAHTLTFERGAWHAGLIGPGLSLATGSRRLFGRVQDSFDAPLVIDADALTLLSEDLTLVARRQAATILTPHAGEAARLLQREIRSDEPSRIAAAREISSRTGAICCLKGHRTVVTDGERVYVNDTGNPGMATAGAGDVLAGIAVAYLALVTTLPRSDWTAFEAAAAAVRVHGLAGDRARARFGARALIASDLIDALTESERP